MAIAAFKNEERTDLEAIKAKQQATWSSGDYAVVGTTLQSMGEQLCETIDLKPGSKVLDVAAGNGNVTLAAARRFCEVTSTDYVEALLDKARGRADAEGLKIAFRAADAEALPFPDESFDYVVSTVGVMFAPNQQQAASEMFRVCRRGGRVGLANWTPDGAVGQLFKVLGRHVPPPRGLTPPALWGTRAHLEELFSEASRIEVFERSYTFRYKSPEHFIDVFRNYYGPVHKAFQALGPSGQEALESETADILASLNRASDGTLVFPAGYIEAVITK